MQSSVAMSRGRSAFGDGTCDAVVVQAVLEHVLQPDVVVAEIHRVLRPDGLVYAETPFM
jgi:2-polyprenyl-3-methyl-5-hydroxy-6-metoxy-1,4-benzoquinol methylase